jgi:hypothetical protein
MAEPIPGWLAGQFEHWRPHLASVAYAMLGSPSPSPPGTTVSRTSLTVPESLFRDITNAQAAITSACRTHQRDHVSDGQAMQNTLL